MSGAEVLPAAFGRYRPIEELGTGAMGKVYLAIDPLIDRRVAVKVISATSLTEEDREAFLQRFRTEARAAALCAHPAIVAIYDFSDDGPTPFIVMEHVPGTNLARLLRRPSAERQADVPAMLNAMLEVLGGLQAAHAVGVVHRDIKPSNIMLTPQGAVKIADFGIARLETSALTLAGDMIGTPGYMAPEQALGQPVDHRTDLFAAAAMLYEILHGRPPFSGGTLAQTILRLTGPAPAELGEMAGAPMGQVLARGLAKDPAARFASAAEFADALRQALPMRGGLPDVDETRVLVRGTTGAPVTGTAGLRGSTGGTTAPPGFPLSPGAQAAAVEALAFVVGPIARVLVRKAAAQATNPAAFLDLLCAHVAPAEAAALRRRLQGVL